MIGRKYVLANSTGSLAHSDRLTARNRQSGVRDATWGPLCVISCEWRRSRVHAVASHGHSQQVNKAADTPRDIVRGQVVRRRTGVRTIEAELLNTTQCASTQNKQTTSPRSHHRKRHNKLTHKEAQAANCRTPARRRRPALAPCLCAQRVGVPPAPSAAALQDPAPSNLQRATRGRDRPAARPAAAR